MEDDGTFVGREPVGSGTCSLGSLSTLLNGTLPLHKHLLNLINASKVTQGKGVVTVVVKISRLKFSRSEANP